MEHAAPDDRPEALKPINWYSGWRLFAMAAATVLGAKLIGILGAVVGVILFLWLQPKRGTGLALAASAVVGAVVAVLYSAVLLPVLYPPQADSAAQVANPNQPSGISHNNPFADPNYGKELLQKQQ